MFFQTMKKQNLIKKIERGVRRGEENLRPVMDGKERWRLRQG
jgi:hypothetical protein